MPYENLLYEVEESLALITINRPERHNAISLATLDDLHAAVTEAATDETVRTIAITGAGDKAFASGSAQSRTLARRVIDPVCQCSNWRPVVRIIGKSASGTSAGAVTWAGVNRARPSARGNPSPKTIG